MTVDEIRQTLAKVKEGLTKNKAAVGPVLPMLDQFGAKIALNPTVWITAIQLLGGSDDDAMKYLAAGREVLDVEHKLIDGDTTERLIKIIDFVSNRTFILNLIAPFIK